MLDYAIDLIKPLHLAYLAFVEQSYVLFYMLHWLFSAKLSVVPIDDYEPIPGSAGGLKLQTALANNVFSTVVPPHNINGPASGNTTTPLYAVVDKSRKGEAESKPVTRNISELYAKVSKPKKSTSNQADSSPSTTGPDCKDQSSSPGIAGNVISTRLTTSPVEQSTPDDQYNLPNSHSSKQSVSGYDSIDFSASSNYDNVIAGELVSKEPMYEEMATVVSKVDQSHVASH